ncbi:MAG: glycosyltransferase family 4 protein [Deltaproteobacteria bacterium]|nr:glycosyltransferase family 4 protein [Deltaproteobacteria bacterium]
MTSPRHATVNISGGNRTRIFLDASSTYVLGLNTGVQRLVRNVVRYAGGHERRLGIDTSAVVCAGGAFHPITENDLAVGGRAAPGEKSPGGRREIASLAVRPRPGDILILLEGGRRVRHLRRAIRSWRQQGARAGLFVHDLLVLSHPDWFPEGTEAGYEEWLRWAGENLDFYLANSETTRGAARHFWGRPTEGIDGSPRRGGASVHLGCDFDRDVGEGRQRPERLRWLDALDTEGHPLFLAVGTLEPRKNHHRILDAFDAVWSRGDRPALLLAGREGWLAEGLLDRIARHPENERLLFHRSDLDDAELAHGYTRAAALICASSGEGFDIPLVEGLAHGLPVLVSDIPIHREVGREFCRYFDVDDSDTLAELIHKVEAREPVAPSDAFQADVCRTWDTCTGELLERALTLARSSK